MMEREKLISLVTAVQNSQDGAAGELYDAFYDDIYYHILKTVDKDPELAADLTQDTFMEILETIHKLEEPLAFVTWSKQIAYHKCTAYFRKRREVLLDEQEDGYSAFDTLEEDRAEFIPDEALDKEDFRDTIRAMISELPEEQRSALLLRYFNEVSVKEIAQIQGVTEGTVKSRLNYARKAIKTAVEAYEKKHDIRLHCAGVVPMLLWFFRVYRRAQGAAITAGSATAVFAAGETAAAAGTAAAGAAAGTAAAGTATKTGIIGGIKAFAQTLAGKVVAGVTAAAVVAGGTAIVVEQLREPYKFPEVWSGYGQTCTTDALGVEMSVQFRLQIDAVTENAYEGSLQVTWEDGESYSSECELELYAEKESRLGYELHVDTLLLRGFSDDPMVDHYTNILYLTYDRDTDAAWIVIQVTGSDDQPFTHKIDLTMEDTSAESVLRSGREKLKIWSDPDTQICVMRPDGTYTWMSGEEYRAVLETNGGYADIDVAVFVRYKGSKELTLWWLDQSSYKEQVELPGEIDGYPVTKVDRGAFYLEDHVRSVSLPGTVREIGAGGFYAHGLEELRIPEGVERLGMHAFSCESLRSITLPASLTQVDGALFADCDALVSVEVDPANPVYHSAGNCLIETETGVLVAGCAVSQIPDDGSVTAIGKYAFMWLRELTYLEIPEGVTEIGYCAFQQCVWLEEISLPASLERIGQNAFRFCHRLKTVHYAGTMEQFNAIQGLDRLGTDFACTVYCTDGVLSIG